jgi:hypothetical protein
MENLVELEILELASTNCFCNTIDPRVIEGGGMCDSCWAKNECRKARERKLIHA